MLFEFGIKDIVDIVVVAFGLYYIYRLMKQSRSLNIFIGVLIFIALWLVVTYILDMRLLGAILDKLVSVGVIAFIVLFQEEIRKFLYSMGTHQSLNAFFRLFNSGKGKRDGKHVFTPIVLAAQRMSIGCVGALIVIERNIPLNDIIKTGEEINADINQRLIENIFFKNSPLHDGAMIISNKRIKAAGCILPVSHDLTLPKEMGLRHRAAMAMSLESDAVVVVVSEETGAITAFIKGEYQQRLSAEKLENILAAEL